MFLLVTAARGQTLWEYDPYRVTIVVSTADGPPFSAARRDALVRRLAQRAEIVAGPLWDANIASGTGEAGSRLTAPGEPLPVESWPAEWLDHDKVLFIHVDSVAAGWRIVARELDVATRTWGTPVVRVTPQAELIEDESFRAAWSAFAPLGEVQSAEAGTATLRMRGGLLACRDPAARGAAAGTVFRPIVRTERTGDVTLEPLAWTVLVAREPGPDGRLPCDLHTGVGSPFRNLGRRRTRHFAVAVAPPGGGTRLRLLARAGDDEFPLVGYDVLARTPGSDVAVQLGRTDRQGEILVLPGPQPVRLLHVQNGTELLARLPLVPGLESVVEARLPDDRERLAIEGYLFGLQEALVDAVARREILLTRIQARIDEGKLDDARALLAQLERLPTRSDLLDLLEERRRRSQVGDARTRGRIDKQFKETQDVINRYLDPRPVEELGRKLAATAQR
jgi:hypothetical protein